jgi:hypothetical protein
MALSISDLVRDLTKEGVLADLLEIAEAFGLTTTAWQSGEPAKRILTIFAEQIARLWNGVLVNAVRSGFLDYATGDWLTLVAYAAYNTLRNDATFATASITLENRGGGFYTFVPGDVRIRAGSGPAAGKTYTNTTGGALASWGGGIAPYPTLTLTFQADEAGEGSSTAVSTIEAFPTSPVAAPAGVYALTNGNAFTGQSEESDADLRTRARLYTGVLSPAGAAAAYQVVTFATRKTAAGGLLLPGDAGYADGVSVAVNRVRVVDQGFGVVGVMLASSGGEASGDTATVGTDVFLVNAAIQLLVVPAGITALVASADAIAAPCTITVYVDRASNVTAADAITAATAAVAAYFRTLPIGGNRLTPGGSGYAFKTEIEAAASSPVGIFKATMSQGDLWMAGDDVAVPTISVTATVVTQ